MAKAPGNFALSSMREYRRRLLKRLTKLTTTDLLLTNTSYLERTS